MAYDSRFDEWVQKLKEESFQNNTFDRRKFIQGAGKIAGLSLGLTIAQSVGAFEVNLCA